MTTTQKHRAFVAEPMGEKPVTELPGIGPVLGGRLAENGFGQANRILGQYLVLNRDEGEFRRWMRNTCGANAKQQGDCYRGLGEWCNSNL